VSDRIKHSLYIGIFDRHKQFVSLGLIIASEQADIIVTFDHLKARLISEAVKLKIW
jgi:hypothetical protein